jgi:FK506-binding protein 3
MCAVRQEEAAKAQLLAKMSLAREEREKREAVEAQAVAEEKAAQLEAAFHEHLGVRRFRKGDGVTWPKHGDTVAITYNAVLAGGVEHGGEALGGQPFDTTLDTVKKVQKPLEFRLGAGKAIRGLEECLRTMSLGERVEVTIDPRWAYKKGGLQDDEGNYIVPPNACAASRAKTPAAPPRLGVLGRKRGV